MPNENQAVKEQVILEIEHETFEAIKHGDAEALHNILADDFIYRTPTGEDTNKTDFITAATTMPFKILSVWGENLRVRFYEETAVLTGVQHAQVEDQDGKGLTSSVAFTDIFVKRDDRWLMSLAFGVEMGIKQ